jgi:hypothetical protein
MKITLRVNGTWHSQAFLHDQRVSLAEGDALVIDGQPLHGASFAH